MKRSLFAALAVIFGIGLATPRLPPAADAVEATPDHRPLAVHRAPAPRKPPAPAQDAASIDDPLPQLPSPQVSTTATQPDADVIAMESPLNQAMLTTLVQTGRMTLELPDGQALALIVDEIDERRGHQRIRVRSAGGTGQFTRANWGFFGTIATPRGVYSIENQGLKTYIVNHSELDRRNLPGLDDARYPLDA